jgi:glycosyltransferase involved in cell wall biosynthesis
MRLRLPSNLSAGPPAVLAHGPVVLVLPAHDEAPRIASVIGRLPAIVCSRTTVCVVVDDGSSDGTGAIAMAHGADVVRHEAKRGLGAAVRTGLRRGIELDASALAFCDADGEYDPAELERLVAPIAAGEAHYVVGSRFAGTIEHMRPHRRLGNRVLTALTRFASRRAITDGQSGYRALSRAALECAEIDHDYNYAQVLTLDLVGKGFGYHEVPITYRFRSSGTSFVRVVPYLRHVLPAMSRVVQATNIA